jgi:uncharacterized protein YlxW (UPF0749 family)
MAIAARKIESEAFMEERVARLEVKVDHLQTDVTELKAKMVRLEEKLEAFKEVISSLKVSRWVDRVWWLIIAAGMLGVMARGFKWL